jgi:hypothetical protein
LAQEKFNSFCLYGDDILMMPCDDILVMPLEAGTSSNQLNVHS